MILEILDHQAEAARRRYESLTLNWSGLYSRGLSNLDFSSAQAASAIVQEAYQLANAYLEAEKDRIVDAIDQIASDAHQAVLTEIASVAAGELTDAALAHLTQTQNYLSDEIIAQIHRDIALVRRTLQSTVLSATIQARSRRISFRAALIEHRVKNQDELDFRFVDRRLRSTPAKTFVGSIWRYALLSAHNETTLMTLVDHGLDRAAVRRVENGAVIQTEVISVTGRGGLRAYPEVRNDLFHPNARSWLAMERADV
ncbi:MAG: hypothetical protein DI537_13795 [Stutzerimonas stutzeri]|nr:MAG: hypothetical protein DI537_13795 [Stutzerimonas stutzeri]